MFGSALGTTLIYFMPIISPTFGNISTGKRSMKFIKKTQMNIVRTVVRSLAATVVCVFDLFINKLDDHLNSFVPYRYPELAFCKPIKTNQRV